MKPARHTFIVGLASDELGYQVPFAKWNGSCHACAPFVLAWVPGLCPVQPIDCGTVFLNNVGRQVDPVITSALERTLDALDDERCVRTETTQPVVTRKYAEEERAGSSPALVS